MKKLLLILGISTTLLSCDKETVEPLDKGIQPPIITNNVIITVNQVNALDSLKIISGDVEVLARTITDDDDLFLCNFTNNIYAPVQVKGDCSTNTIEIISNNPIYLEYNGDIVVNYK